MILRRQHHLATSKPGSISGTPSLVPVSAGNRNAFAMLALLSALAPALAAAQAGSPQASPPLSEKAPQQDAEVHKIESFLPYAPDKKVFVTELFTQRSHLRQPARAAIFLTGPEFRGNFWDIPVEGYSAPAMAAQRGFFAYTLDYVGVGESFHPEDGSKITYLTNVEAVRKLIEHVRRSRKVEKVDLIGEHFGAEVAAVLAKDSASVRSVFMSTANYKAIHPEMVARFYTPEFEAFFRSHADGYWEPNFLEKTLAFSPNEELRAYVLATQQGKYPTGPFLQYFELGLPVIEAAAQKVPLHLVAGEHDPFLAPGDMEELAADWGGGATLVVISGGHKAPRIEAEEIAGEYFKEMFDFIDPVSGIEKAE